MDACFVFTKDWDETGCFCLKLSEEGEVLEPLAKVDYDTLLALQKNTSTTVVEWSQNTSLFTLAMPWIAERKARLAIPYALEDQLAQPVDSLHFAFDKRGYQNKHYSVTVISKQRMDYLLHFLATHAIHFDCITTDWFALHAGEIIVSGEEVLVNQPDFQGVLVGDLALSYLKEHPTLQALFFTDSNLNFQTETSLIQQHSYSWIAKRLLQSKPLNLCQGAMQRDHSKHWIQQGYQWVGGLCCFWLLSILLVNAWSLHTLNKQMDAVDKQIATIYYQFFPKATHVISPKFRVSQLLGASTSDTQARFWFLLDQFSQAIQSNQWTIEQLRFQNNALLVTLESPDFARLELLENKLKSLQLTVKQTQASNRDQQVVATLELK